MDIVYLNEYSFPVSPETYRLTLPTLGYARGRRLRLCGTLHYPMGTSEYANYCIVWVDGTNSVYYFPQDSLELVES